MFSERVMKKERCLWCDSYNLLVK